MSIQRTKILRGPCQLQYNGQTFYSKGDVTVALNMKVINVDSSAIGRVDYRDDDMMAEIQLTPDGQTTAGILPIYFPFCQAGIYPGASVFGAADLPLVIWTRNGEKHTFFNAAVTKQPDYDASAVKTPFGAMTFRCLRSMAAAWSAANNLVAVTSANYPGDSTFNVANILTTPYGVRWGNTALPTGTATATQASPAVFADASDGLVLGDTILNTGYANAALNGFMTVASIVDTGHYTLYVAGTTTPVNNTVAPDSGTFVRQNAFDYFETEAGFSVATNVSLHEETSDTSGIIDLTFQSIEVTLKAIPIGPLPTDLETAMGFQGTGAVRGRSRAAVGANLYLTGTGLNAKLSQASIVDIQLRSGMAVKRVGTVTWRTTMTLASGVPNPPLILSTGSIA